MPLPVPGNLALIPTKDGVIIRKNWLTWKLLPIGAFVAVWDGFLWIWMSTVTLPAHMGAFLVVPPILIGVWLTYYFLVSFINKTDIIISSSNVAVTTHPAPWYGNRSVKCSAIKNIIVRGRVGKGILTYAILCVDSSNKAKKLITTLADCDEADFVAEEIG